MNMVSPAVAFHGRSPSPVHWIASPSADTPFMAYFLILRYPVRMDTSLVTERLAPPSMWIRIRLSGYRIWWYVRCKVRMNALSCGEGDTSRSCVVCSVLLVVRLSMDGKDVRRDADDCGENVGGGVSTISAWYVRCNVWFSEACKLCSKIAGSVCCLIESSSASGGWCLIWESHWTFPERHLLDDVDVSSGSSTMSMQESHNASATSVCPSE